MALVIHQYSGNIIPDDIKILTLDKFNTDNDLPKWPPMLEKLCIKGMKGNRILELVGLPKSVTHLHILHPGIKRLSPIDYEFQSCIQLGIF